MRVDQRERERALMERKKVAIVSSFFRHGQWRGMMRFGQKAGWICQRFTTENLDRLVTWAPDGVIFQIDEYDKPLLDYIRGFEGCRVGLRAALGMEDEMPLVLPDLAAFGREVARHFAENNYRRLCYLGPSTDETANPGSTHSHGMAEVADELELELECIFPDQRGTWRKLGLERRHALTTGWERFWELGPALTEHLLKFEEPVGLFSAFVEPAMEFMEMATSAGVQVPGQIGMAAQTEDGLTGTVTKVPLSCIVPDFERQGFEAGALLEKVMNGEKIPANHREFIGEREFTIRQSSDQMVSIDPQVNEMVEFIRMHAHEPHFCSDSVADRMGCSLRSVQIRFNQVFQRGVADIIRLHRTQRGADLLSTTDRRIKDIVTECGFTSSPQFERAIKKMYGMSPTEFRRQKKRGRGAGESS